MFKNAKTIFTAACATLVTASVAHAEILPLQTNQKIFCGIENSITWSSNIGSALMVSGTGNFPGFRFEGHDNWLRMSGVEKNRGGSGILTVTEYGQSKTYTIERSPPPVAPYTLKDIELTIPAGYGVDLSDLAEVQNSETFDGIWPNISPDFAKETRIIVEEKTSSDLGQTTGTYFTASPTAKGGVFEVGYSSIVNLFPTIAESNCSGSAFSSGDAKIRITVEPATTPPEPETPENTACKPMPVPANGAKFVFRYPTGSACS
ncbi:hypothetical protein [Brucella intermedia]|uniref:hypothetical protein n=1 Tax=Brucella intermedia TaxID=94625 RepID=UPI000EFD8A91|nr:hypothetical protein [Brucella intermedia]KAB2720381.1 hypothetical protein F9K75_04735 [Brucella intermedia]